VRYDSVNAILLKEFLKEHRRVGQQGRDLQEQKAINAELRSAIAQQERHMKALVAELQDEIQTVNAQLQLTKSKPQIATNSQ
jgi:small-conductance mechanosensitive channel